MSTPESEAKPYVAENLARLRRQRNLSLRQLATRLAGIGQPINVDGVNRIEMGKRQVTTAELLALALVLDVSPVTLLLPPRPADAKITDVPPVRVTPEMEVPWEDAWRWAVGDQAPDGRMSPAWIETNRPFERASLVAEVTRFLVARLGKGPWKIEVRHEGGDVQPQGRLVIGDLNGQRQ